MRRNQAEFERCAVKVLTSIESKKSKRVKLHIAISASRTVMLASTPAYALMVCSQDCSKGEIVVVRRILIVEDESRIAAFLERGLRKHGYATSIAKDGVEAVEKGVSTDFDLMLLDLGLPGKDGWTVLKELEKIGRKPPVIIIVTARDDVGDLVKSQAFGVNDYVTKPFSFNDLLSRVKSRLDSHSR